MVTEKILVGVEVERRVAQSRWQDHIWRPTALRTDPPELAEWAVLAESGTVMRFHAGIRPLTIHSADTKVYKDNLESPTPSVYVVLRRGSSPSGWRLYLVTVDPSEAHSHADVGDDLVEALPMPEPILRWLAPFVARHHVERKQWKRKRDRADLDARAINPASVPEEDDD